MIMANGGHGIYLTGWDGWISDNIIHTNLGAAIYSDKAFATFSITQNRIEWNHGGGINIKRGGSLNINSNCFDRAYGPSIEIRGGDENMSSCITVSGNIFRRSGKYREDMENNPYLNTHIYFTDVENTVVSGNAFLTGKDDHRKGTFSPNYSIVLKNSDHCIINNNALDKGSLIESIITL